MIKIKAGYSLLILLATVGFPSVTVAQTETLTRTPTEVIEEAFSKNYPNFYNDNNFRRDLDLILGFGSLFRNSFPENEIVRDAELLNVVYRDLLSQQTSTDPYLRTPDLPNPYNTSILMSPRLNVNQLQVGTEFRFDTEPPR